jgi:hypothetical protein
MPKMVFSIYTFISVILFNGKFTEKFPQFPQFPRVHV